MILDFVVFEGHGSDFISLYILVSICPMKLTKPVFSYFPDDEAFHTIEPDLAMDNPALGFMFPTFDDRAANIFCAPLYTRDPANLHAEFIDGVLEGTVPASAMEQRDALYDCLRDSLGEDMNLDIMQTIHDNVRRQIEEYKSTPSISRKEIDELLKACNVPEEKRRAFEESYLEQFGAVGLPATTVIEPKKFEVATETVTISVDSSRSDLVETRRIDEAKYVMVRVEGDLTVNGVALHY